MFAFALHHCFGGNFRVADASSESILEKIDILVQYIYIVYIYINNVHIYIIAIIYSECFPHRESSS